MKQRLAGFDLLRVMGLVLILLCHFVRVYGWHQLDEPLGVVGNFVFFVLSGWLLGIGWRNKGCPGLGFRYLWHRLSRLAVPLWLFTIPYFVYFKMSGFPISARDVVLNLCLLNWFDRLPGMTAYWFLTAISAFYWLIVAYSWLPSHRRLTNWHLWTVCVGIVLTQIILSVLRVPFGYVLVLMWGGFIGFVRGTELLEFVSGGRNFIKFRWADVLMFIVVAFLFCSGFVWGWWSNGTSLAYWMAVFASIILGKLAWRLTWMSGCPLIGYFSRISYETYLVHQVVWGLVVSTWGIPCAVAFPVYVLFSIILASIIHCVAVPVLHLRLFK